MRRIAVVVKVKGLFAQGEIFQQGRSGRADPRCILVVGNAHARRCGQPLGPIGDMLVDFVLLFP